MLSSWWNYIPQGENHLTAKNAKDAKDYLRELRAFVVNDSSPIAKTALYVINASNQ
jgi:hypothetical protein